MAKLRKFTFDFDFDAPAKPAAPPPSPEPPPPPPEPIYVEPPEPMFSESDVELVREQAYQMGRSEGFRDAEQQLTQQHARLIAASLSGIEQRLRDLVTQQTASRDAHLRESLSLAVAIVRKMFPELARRHGVDEIETVLHECLMQIDHDPRVTIRLNPQQIDEIRERSQHIVDATGFEGRLVFTADPRLAVGDCRIEWGDGGAERDQAELWADIAAILERGGVLPPETP